MKRLPPNDPKHPSRRNINNEGISGLVHRTRMQAGLVMESGYEVFSVENRTAISVTSLSHPWNDIATMPYEQAAELEKQGKLVEWVETAIAIHMLTA